MNDSIYIKVKQRENQCVMLGVRRTSLGGSGSQQGAQREGRGAGNVCFSICVFLT